TLSYLFPEVGADSQSSDRWKPIQETLASEVKGVTWTTAMPDIAQKTTELFDIEIPDILSAAWKKSNELQKALEESEKAPDKIMYLGLAEHTVRSEHHPFIEVRVKNTPIKKPIQFTVRLSFKLTGFILKIQKGLITEIQTGTCEVAGNIECQRVPFAERKLKPIKLPGSIRVRAGNYTEP